MLSCVFTPLTISVTAIWPAAPRLAVPGERRRVWLGVTCEVRVRGICISACLNDIQRTNRGAVPRDDPSLVRGVIAPVGQARMACWMRYQPQRPLPLCTRPVRVAQQSWVLCCGCTPCRRFSSRCIMPGWKIRDAKAAHAGAAAQVLRRSISELCAADHGNDPLILAPATKRPKSSLHG